MSFTPTGVEFQARGLGSYLSSLGKANQAQQALGKSVSGIAPSFAQAQGAATGFGSKLGSLIPSVGGFASALGGVATVAGGIVVANVFGKLVEGVTAFVSIGFDAIDSAQRLEAGLGALLTANNLYERSTQTVTIAVGDFSAEQEKAGQKTEDLAFKNETLAAKLDLQKASIQEQKQRIIELTNQYGENGLATIEAVKKLALMEQQAQGTERQIGKNTESINNLKNATQEYTTVTKTAWKQTMDFGEAQDLAARQSEDLLNFIDKLSIVSPFESDQVALVAKLAVGAGLAVDEVKNFTAGFLDLGAAVGLGSDELAFAADQLLQVSKVGKITQVDLKQLRRLGIDLEKIIGVEMGMSIDEFNKKAAESPEIFNELFNSVATFSEKTFGGTAKKMASSLSGLQSTFTDIFRIGAKNMLRPLVEAIGPVASEMLGKLSEIVTGPQLAAIGAAIPKVIFGALEVLGGGKGSVDLFAGLRGLGLDTDTAKRITDITRNIRDLFETFQTSGVGGLAVALGVPQETVDIITNISLQVQRLFDIFKADGATGLAFALGIPMEVIEGLHNAAAEVQKIVDIFSVGMEVGGLSGGFLAVFEDLKAGISQALPALAQELLLGIPTALGAVATGIGDFLRNVTPQIQEAMFEWAPVFWEWTNNVINTIGAALGGVILAIGAWVTSGEGQGQMTEIGRGLGVAMVNGLKFIGENTDDFLIVAGKVAAGLLAAIAAITGELIVVGATIVAGMIAGIIESLGGGEVQIATIGEMKGIINQIAEDTLTIAKVIGTRIIIGIIQGFKSTVSTLNEFKTMVGEKFELIIEAAQEILNPEKWEEIGIAVIEGVVAGIESAKDKVLEVLKQLAQDALAGVMDSLGISSPSTEFEYVGRMMAAGVAKGWDDKKGDIMKAVMDFGDIGHFTKLGLSQTKSEHLKGAFKGAVTALFEQIAAGKAGATQLEALTKQNAGAWAKFVDQGNIAFDHVVKLIKEGGAELAAEIKKQMMDRLVSMGQGFATFGDFLIERMKGQDEAALSAIQSIGDLTKKLDEQKSKLATLKTELGAIAGKYGESSKEVIEKQKAIAALTAEIEKNEKAMADQNKTLAKEAKTSKTATISMLQQFLAGSGEFFKFTLQSDLVGVNHVMLDRVKAQEKLNQLLEEERKKQEEIAKIEKAKADLAFLQQQISLLQLIKDQGLDPADILGGIQLGLGASMSDLLKVTSEVIQAMVDQINKDLQIASPSKVMAKIGSRVMQGVGQGLEGGKQKLYQAMDNIPILNGSLASPLPMPAMGMAGGGNNFNGPLVSISVGQVNSPADEDRLVQKAVRAVERKMR